MLEEIGFFQLFKLFISAIFSLFMFLEYQRNKSNEFIFLGSVFLLFFLKELVYIFTNLYGVFYENIKNPVTGAVQKVLHNHELFNLRYFIWHISELIFVLVLAHIPLFWIGSVRKNGVIPFIVTFSVGIFASIGLLVYVFVSIKNPFYVISNFGNNETTVSFTNQIAKLFTESWWVWGITKAVILGLVITPVARVYGYVAERLPHLFVSKGILITAFIIFIVLYLFSSIVFIHAVENFGYFLLELIGFITLNIFAYRIFRADVMDMSFRIQDLEKEKQLIIDLMREIAETLSVGIEMDKVLGKIAEAAIEGTSSKAAAILLKDPSGDTMSVKYVKGLFPPVKPIKVESYTVLKESQIVEIFKSSKISIGETYLGLPASTGEPLLIRDAESDPRVLQTAKGIVDIKSVIVSPLKIEENILGVMAVLNKATGISHNESDLSLVQTLADQASITIRQFEMYKEILEKKQAERDLNIAHEIQMSLLPKRFPSSNKFDMYGFSIPAKGVGGDYFDYITFSPTKIGIMIADVSGKGVPAALIMVMIRSITRAIASLSKDANEIMAQINNSLSGDIVEDRYATAFYCALDSERRILNYCNAGHGPLLLYRGKSNEFEMLDTEGMPVGIMPGVSYGHDFVILDKGDIGVLYTDGITEAMNEKHDLYGIERLQNAIYKAKDLSAKEIAEYVLKDVSNFVGTAPQHDDETMIIFKIL